MSAFAFLSSTLLQGSVKELINNWTYPLFPVAILECLVGPEWESTLQKDEPPTVAYYEGETDYPPTHFLPLLAKALGVSTDQLLGVAKARTNGRVRYTRLWRRFSQLEKRPPAERKPVVQMIDAFIKAKQGASR